MYRWLLLVAVLAAFTMLPATSAAAEYDTAGVKRCHAWAFYPNVLIDRAVNMKCGTAKQQMRRYKKPIRFRFTTPGGFHCKRISGFRLAGTWRCGRNHQAFRFRFAD